MLTTSEKYFILSLLRNSQKNSLIFDSRKTKKIPKGKQTQIIFINFLQKPICQSFHKTIPTFQSN